MRAFFERAVRTESGCWLWPNVCKRHGYGRLMRDDGRIVRAHRYAWTLVHGPIPDGVFVCHRCDVRACVNPDHLFLGNKMAKLTEASVREARARVAAGETRTSIARELGVTKTAINYAVQRRTWAHVE